MAANFLDRAIASVAPSWALARTQDRMRFDTIHAMPSVSALAEEAGLTPQPAPPANSWWRPRPRDARSDTLPRLPIQRGQSRELARTSPIAAGAINTNIDRIVGTGLGLSPMPNLQIPGWTRQIEFLRRWLR